MGLGFFLGMSSQGSGFDRKNIFAWIGVDIIC